MADNASVGGMRRIAIIVVAVLCAAPAGCSTNQRPLAAPERLAGLGRSTDAELVAAAEKATSESKVELGGHPTVGAYYGEKANAVLLVATRDKINLAKQWREIERDAGKPLPRVELHGMECIDEGNGAAYLCMWSEAVSGVLIDVRAGSTIDQAAAAADEAKKALN